MWRTAIRNIVAHKLRLFTTDPSSDGGSAFPVSSAWTEPGVSWKSGAVSPRGITVPVYG